MEKINHITETTLGILNLVIHPNNTARKIIHWNYLFSAKFVSELYMFVKLKNRNPAAENNSFISMIP